MKKIIIALFFGLGINHFIHTDDDVISAGDELIDHISLPGNLDETVDLDQIIKDTLGQGKQIQLHAFTVDSVSGEAYAAYIIPSNAFIRKNTGTGEYEIKNIYDLQNPNLTFKSSVQIGTEYNNPNKNSCKFKSVAVTKQVAQSSNYKMIRYVSTNPIENTNARFGPCFIKIYLNNKNPIINRAYSTDTSNIPLGLEGKRGFGLANANLLFLWVYGTSN